MATTFFYASYRLARFIYHRHQSTGGPPGRNDVAALEQQASMVCQSFGCLAGSIVLMRSSIKRFRLGDVRCAGAHDEEHVMPKAPLVSR